MYIIFAGSTGNIVVCISPLTALMMDQQAKFAGYRLSTEFVGEAQTDKEVYWMESTANIYHSRKYSRKKN